METSTWPYQLHPFTPDTTILHLDHTSLSSTTPLYALTAPLYTLTPQAYHQPHPFTPWPHKLIINHTPLHLDHTSLSSTTPLYPTSLSSTTPLYTTSLSSTTPLYTLTPQAYHQPHPFTPWPHKLIINHTPLHLDHTSLSSTTPLYTLTPQAYHQPHPFTPQAYHQPHPFTPWPHKLIINHTPLHLDPTSLSSTTPRLKRIQLFLSTPHLSQTYPPLQIISFVMGNFSDGG